MTYFAVGGGCEHREEARNNWCVPAQGQVLRLKSKIEAQNIVS